MISDSDRIHLVADLHTHTLVSSHAFSTLNEMISRAQELGLCALAVTDHGLDMPDAPHPWYFSNLLNQPNFPKDRFLLLKGVEANAVGKRGVLDMEDELLKKLDWVIVSLHRKCVPYLSKAEATDLWLRVAENPSVDMIGHAEQRQYYFDYDRVTKAFTAAGKVVELNANSPVSRPGNEEYARELMLACKENGTQIAVNSDAHSLFDLANWNWALDLLAEIEFPSEQVVNSSMHRLAALLKEHGRPIAMQAEELADELSAQ